MPRFNKSEIIDDLLLINANEQKKEEFWIVLGGFRDIMDKGKRILENTYGTSWLFFKAKGKRNNRFAVMALLEHKI